MANLVSKIGKAVKSFFVWAWRMDGETVMETIFGSLMILLVVTAMLLIAALFVLLIYATFVHSGWWVFAWIPAFLLGLFLEIGCVRAIMTLFEDFFYFT